MEYRKLRKMATISISNVDKKTAENENEVRLCNFVDVYRNWAITKNMISNFMVATAKESEIEKYALHKGDVCITKDSETKDDIGMSTYIADDIDNLVLGYHCALISPDKSVLDGKYLNAFLQTDFVRRFYELNASGSGQRYTLSLDAIGDIPIPVISLEEQKKKGELLSLIDRKIENNNKINDNLQHLITDIYNYWFVQLCFPNLEGNPFKHSGGEVVFDRDINRQKPSDWHVSTVSDVCNTQLGGTPDTSIDDYWGGEIPWLNSGEVASSPIISAEKRITTLGLNKSATSFSKAGAVLMSITRYIRPSVLGIDACYNQSVVAIEPSEDIKTEYLYPFFLSMVDTYMTLRTGAQQPHINKKIVDETYMLIPSKNVLSKYYELMSPILRKQVLVAKETQELIILRDKLLPLLLSGQATIVN